jgi:pyruvate dehydrogenase E2 component (dihydrolipoamide acetyltransferase)
VTAARLRQAKQEIPHFYLRADCDVTSLTQLRAALNRGADPKVTITDLIVFVVAQALRKVPQANSTWVEDSVRMHPGLDIAVAVNTTQGLLTPVLRACERKTLSMVSRELKELSEKARSGRLRPEEYTNGTFTVSNLGMFGVTSITPIINPPQSCILGVGAIERKPIAVEGQLSIGEVMSCTLAADHRAIDGATGAGLLAEIRRLLENPMSMLLTV